MSIRCTKFYENSIRNNQPIVRKIIGGLYRLPIIENNRYRPIYSAIGTCLASKEDCSETVADINCLRISRGSSSRMLLLQIWCREDSCAS